MPKFINTELKSDSESSDSDLDSEKIGAKIDNELMAKLSYFTHTFLIMPIFFEGVIFSPSFVRVKN